MEFDVNRLVEYIQQDIARYRAHAEEYNEKCRLYREMGATDAENLCAGIALQSTHVADSLTLNLKLSLK